MTRTFNRRVNNFNSHAHVERDDKGLYLMDHLKDFNSHAHVERDDYEEARRKILGISTHTLTWSVTRKLLAVR